jgi:hypothetical protein
MRAESSRLFESCGLREATAIGTMALGQGPYIYMKTVREFCLGRTIIVIGAMFVWAWASQQAHSQNLDCNNGCGTYAEYALAQRLHLRESIQNLPSDKIATWFSHHPQYSSRLKELAAECGSSCAKCGDWTCP